MNKADRKAKTEKDTSFQTNENRVEGRRAVLEAVRAGQTIERIYIRDGLHDHAIEQIKREAKEKNIPLRFVEKELLERLSEQGNHQGVIAAVASFSYAEVEDILQRAKEKNEDPFLFLLDNIEDPHNLGAIIRTANVCGAHGVIIPKNRSASLTATAVRASAGAVYHTPVAKVTNISRTIDGLKAHGIWIAAGVMDAPRMYDVNLKGPLCLVIGNEGNGISRLVREHCDLFVSVPVFGEIESLNASVAAAVIAYEIVRQRTVSSFF